MPWFNVDDGFAFHQKSIRAGNAAIGLWVRSGSWCAQQLTDGFIPDDMVAVLGSAVQANRLVNAGLWEKVAGGFQFHDWSDRQRSKEVVLADRAYNARKSALYRDPALLQAVQDRDCGRCRYCGALVNWRDRRGKAGATYDHVDPAGPNSLSNLVVACKSCNSRKRDRTPDEAEMPLLPAGSMGISQAVPDQSPVNLVRTRSEPDQNQVEPSAHQDPLHSTPLPTNEVTTHSPSGSAPRRRATRIPDDFVVTTDMVTWARQRRPDVDGRMETEKFINYWGAKSGKDATKLDWEKTWRNWILNAKASPNHRPPGAPLGTGSKRVDKALGFLSANDPLRESYGIAPPQSELHVLEGGKTA